MEPKMNDVLNIQINEEYFSAYLYFSMSAYFERIGLKGFANWMRVQSDEEHAHSMKFYNFINERGGKVELQAIKAPKNDWESPLEIFEDTLKHEKHITSCIYKLLDQSMELRDHATSSFLQWYVNEQVEEEANVGEILGKLKIANGDGNAILLLDKELSQRVFVDPLAQNTN